MVATSAGPVTSLYIHVPFCAQKCAYCAFYSEASSGEVVERYVGALIRELELVAPDLEPRTVFFGGGTPSLLNLRQWTRVLHKNHGYRLGLASHPSGPSNAIPTPRRFARQSPSCSASTG